MKASELRELSRSELETKIAEVKKTMFNLKFQKASGQLDNPMKIKNLKKDVALIETIAREQELGINKVKTSSKPGKAVKVKKAKAVNEKEVKPKVKDDDAKAAPVKRAAKKAKSQE
jgi:large subunit ribosomal protein L29